MMIEKNPIVRIVGVALVCCALLATAAAAATINGTVVNATTGDRHVNATVLLVNPSGGMMEEQKVEAVDGKFALTGVDASVPVYLLRVDHQGVMYTETFRPAGRDVMDAAISIYDTTSSWEGVHVVVPHLAAVAHEGHLQIEMLYEVHNHSDPPKTLTGESAQLRVYIPEDKLEILRSFITYLDVPIDRFPVPTDEPGVYRIDYPIRPGETGVGISYSVPYLDESYTLGQKLTRDVESMTVYAVNPGMRVTSSTTDLGNGESAPDNMTAYQLSDLAGGSDVELTFAGGEPVGAVGQDGGGHGQGTIVIRPNPTVIVSFMLMAIVLLALIAFVGIAEHESKNPLDDRDILMSYYTVLLKRMAKLDDLHEADAIPRDVYSATRDELKTQLASLKYRLHTGKGDKRSKRAKRTARVAGNERTSTS